jgi:hypothetical protein
MTIEDLCSVLNQQGMIQHRRDNTPFSPSLRPLPGQSIRSIRGRKSGTTRKHLQRKQTDDDSSRGPFVPPREYEIVWDPVIVEAYLNKWSEKGYLTLKPEKLKWSPFILQRTTKPMTNAPLTAVDHGNEVKIVDVMVKKGEDGESRPVVVEERLQTPSLSTRDDECSVDSPLLTQDQTMSPTSTRLKAQIEKDHKLALKLANINTPSTRRTRLRSRETSTPQTYNHTPAPDTPVTRSRIANGRQNSNGIPGTPNPRSPSVTSTVSRLRDRERQSRSGSATRFTVTRSRSALKTPSIADDEDGGEGDERDAEGDGDHVDVEADVDEDEKLDMKLSEEGTGRVPMKRLRSRSGTASNRQGSDPIRPAHVDEDLLAASASGIKRSDSNRSLTRKRMRIDSSPIMEDSLTLLHEETKHTPPSTMVVPAVAPECGVPVDGSGTNGTHSDYTSTKADSPPTFKMERILETKLDMVEPRTTLKNGGRFPVVSSLVKDEPAAAALVTSIFPDPGQADPDQASDPISIIQDTDDHGFNTNPLDPLGSRMGEEEDEYGDIDAEGELDDEEGIDIEAVL